MNFGALPPEVNSGRMYSGPGSGPMLAAATAWDGLATQLNSTAASYDSVISGLASDAWSGPSAASMTAAATPYAAWMGTTAAQAQQAATQARAAAAAYDAAFTATVPPPVIAANRSLLVSLIATNVLGQNTAAIAATEAHYAEMWAQDVTAMYGYAGVSAHATALTPFTDPPPTTNGAGAGGQAAVAAHAAAAAGTSVQTTLSQLVSMTPQALQGLAASAPSVTAEPAQSTILSILDALSGPLSPASLYGIGGVPYLLALQCVLLPNNGANVISAVNRALAAGAASTTSADVQLAPGVYGPGGVQLMNSAVPSPVSAGMGNAAPMGRLSVPQGWSAAAPAAKSATSMASVSSALPGTGAAALAATEGQSGLMSDMALGSLAGRAIGVTGGSASRKIAGATGSVAASKPSTATIIVIPPSAED